ncbi:MAG: sugar ABC transporter ATP-binding protein [Alphaproteobacteria bacterium]|nr:sugar ABC transporter ATP-binding protein [Alphaproteobacteria bacterium]
MATPSPVLRLSGIAKRYGGVVALQDVDFSARANSIHAVLGENGAGKSTLIKIVAGVVRPDTGTMTIEGRTVRLSGPADAVRAGVVSVFQELSLVPDLTVAENICIAPAPGRFGLIDKRAQRRRAEELLARVGCEDVNPRVPVRELPLSHRQLVELAKALGRQPRILILDEATSALTARHVETVNRILRQLREQGLTILLISHRMHEIEALADTCSVFRGGRHIETYAQGSRTPGEVLRLMIGREISQVYPQKPERPGDLPTALEVDRLSWGERLHDLSFRVGRGEIVGLGGLDGQGQRTLLLALFGVLRDVRGRVLVDGQPVAIDSPAAAKAAGLDLALVPDDRKSEGLMLSMSVRENATLAALDRLTRGPLIDRQRERRAVSEAIGTLSISAPSPEHPVGALSGGNQQKVVLAKWLMNRPRLILLMDPTRGIDVGTKQEFYRIMRELAAQGIGILFYSTDYDEMIGMCDRVLILYGGRIVRELSGAAITESGIVGASFNLSVEAA